MRLMFVADIDRHLCYQEADLNKPIVEYHAFGPVVKTLKSFQIDDIRDVEKYKAGLRECAKQFIQEMNSVPPPNGVIFACQPVTKAIRNANLNQFRVETTFHVRTLKRQ